jgi:hypothetical protein
MTFAGTDRPPPGRKTARTQDRAPSPLSDPVLIAEWKKNRAGDTIRLTLKNFDGFDLIDVRTWFGGEDGQHRPGKGFAASVRHLPQLSKAINAALAKAHELGLLREAI